MYDPKIRTLLTVVETGNYTKAAKILALTQPAVSQHIKRLGDEYGIKIFYNTKQKLKPTPEGELLIEYGRKVVALTNSLK